MSKLGDKIRSLRRGRGISQEVLAGSLGLSFQAVSKWENGDTMPDVAMIPAIASFFGVSTDELFDYNCMEIEREVEKIAHAAYRFRHSDPAKSEEILRDGLKSYPGNEVLLNNLLYTMTAPERADEMIPLCRALIESARDDAVRYDACRILAEIYSGQGEYAMVRETLAKIPEIYFTKLQMDALLLPGDEKLEPAVKQSGISLEHLLDMLDVLAEYYDARGEHEKARIKRTTARDVLHAFDTDFPETPGMIPVSIAYADRLAELEKALADA
ncbi:MAG: helix-turn-helix transcriptional regulator [Clostridia bacterium]|nr:helix-turn-helix transcriptional regulator [Clostridia bacterium]